MVYGSSLTAHYKFKPSKNAPNLLLELFILFRFPFETLHNERF